jgi:putative ABC transport system permease protein
LYTIIGVVGSLGMNEAIPGAGAGLYHPRAPGTIHPLRIAVHVGDDPEDLAQRLRVLVGEVDPTAIVSEAMPLDEVFSFNSFTMDWLWIGAVTLIAILIALSASGIFALMSFTVVQRTREIGIRAALGARTSDVVRAIARRSLTQLAVGVLLGMPVAWRLLFEFQRDLDRIQDHSPLLLALASGIGAMVAIGLVACVIPTRRALRIMPTEAFRSEV